MVRLDKIILSLVVIVASAVPAAARPDFLELFRGDPFRRTDVDGCAVGAVNLSRTAQNEASWAHLTPPLLRPTW